MWRQLPSVSFSPEEPPAGSEFEAWLDGPDWTDWTRECSLAQLLEPNHVRPDRRLVTMFTEFHRLQTNFPYIFVFIQIPK